MSRLGQRLVTLISSVFLPGRTASVDVDPERRFPENAEGFPVQGDLRQISDCTQIEPAVRARARADPPAGRSPACRWPCRRNISHPGPCFPSRIRSRVNVAVAGAFHPGGKLTFQGPVMAMGAGTERHRAFGPSDRRPNAGRICPEPGPTAAFRPHPEQRRRLAAAPAGSAVSGRVKVSFSGMIVFWRTPLTEYSTCSSLRSSGAGSPPREVVVDVDAQFPMFDPRR